MEFTPQSPEMIAASHLLYYHNAAGGYPGGSFSNKLIELMDMADNENLEKLLKAYPEYEFGVRMLKKSGANKLSNYVLAVQYGVTP